MTDMNHISILVVDDEKDIRDVLEISLIDMGYTVYLADNGKGALRIFEEKKPAIVITDIKMPVMDGIDLLKHIKRKNRDTEVLMVTGHGDMELSISSLKYEAIDFITKPIHVDILEIAVARAVEKITARQKLKEYTEKLELLILEKSKLTSHLLSLGLMIGTISHTIKGLLTNLDGGIYILSSALSSNDEKGVSDGLENLKQATERIKKIILDILLYSKERELKLLPEDTLIFIQEIKHIIDLKRKGTGIHLNIMHDHAPEIIYMDKEFMISALINIFDNAIDTCVEDESKDTHEIRFTISKEKKNVMIRIQDNGCGMDAETKEKIFNLFYSSKGTRGTGFGLYISNSIIKQHGGQIVVSSINGKETCFKISLPL